MTFKHLRQLGDGYGDEEGKQGHDRHGALGMLEGVLGRLYLQSDAARLTARTRDVASEIPVKGRVKALAAFHQQQQDKTTRLDRINLEVIRYRQWLHRQQARITPEGRIDWSRSLRCVEYDHGVQRQKMTRISVRGGLLFTADGKLFDTTKMVTMFSGPGNAIYVMSPEGMIHVSSHSVGYRHHSSLLAGRSVAGAGEMCVRQGRLIWISNKSGHYHPSPLNLLQTLLSLVRQGYGAQIQVNCMYADRSVAVFPTQYDFCVKNKFDNDVVGSVDVIAAYDAYRADQAGEPYKGSYVLYSGMPQVTPPTAPRGASSSGYLVYTPMATPAPQSAAASYGTYNGGYTPLAPDADGYTPFAASAYPLAAPLSAVPYNPGDYTFYSAFPALTSEPASVASGYIAYVPMVAQAADGTPAPTSAPSTYANYT